MAYDRSALTALNRIKQRAAEATVMTSRWYPMGEHICSLASLDFESRDGLCTYYDKDRKPQKCHGALFRLNLRCSPGTIINGEDYSAKGTWAITHYIPTEDIAYTQHDPDKARDGKKTMADTSLGHAKRDIGRILGLTDDELNDPETGFDLTASIERVFEKIQQAETSGTVVSVKTRCYEDPYTNSKGETKTPVRSEVLELVSG